jgi:hypothetical protein
LDINGRGARWMLGQIFFGIIILLFLTGTTSISVSIWLENNTPINYYPVPNNPHREKTTIEDVAEFISTDSEISEVEELAPVSEILESFSMEDLKVEDGQIDLYEDLYIYEDLLE